MVKKRVYLSGNAFDDGVGEEVSTGAVGGEGIKDMFEKVVDEKDG